MFLVAATAKHICLSSFLQLRRFIFFMFHFFLGNMKTCTGRGSARLSVFIEEKQDDGEKPDKPDHQLPATDADG